MRVTARGACARAALASSSWTCLVFTPASRRAP